MKILFLRLLYSRIEISIFQVINGVTSALGEWLIPTPQKTQRKTARKKNTFWRSYLVFLNTHTETCIKTRSLMNIQELGLKATSHSRKARRLKTARRECTQFMSDVIVFY